MAIKRYFSCLVSLLIVICCNCAPKSKKSDHSPHTLYDQKQTGDYNIQLHLKDFQIIAVLSDDASLGDYDYDYDYSDFTVKPISPKPTEIPSPSSTPSSVVSSTTPFPEKPSTIKPSNHPYPILVPSTESPKEKEPTKNEEISISTEGAVTKESTPNQSVEPSKDAATSTAKTPRKDETSSPGKIKVQIIESPASVGIVPGEELHDSGESLPQGEILQLKRCASGFSRDKRGRCRRVRRPATPQLQYGLSRLASNLATRFRQTPSDVSSSSSSESTED